MDQREIEKDKEAYSPADATLPACKVLQQPADTGMHSAVAWTWKDCDHSKILLLSFFFSPFITFDSVAYWGPELTMCLAANMLSQPQNSIKLTGELPTYTSVQSTRAAVTVSLYKGCVSCV